MSTRLVTETRQQQRLAPQQILMASMLLSNSDELAALVREEEQRNVAIEVQERDGAVTDNDPVSEALGDEGHRDDDADGGDNDNAGNGNAGDEGEMSRNEKNNNDDAPDEDVYNDSADTYDPNEDNSQTPFELATAEVNFREDLKQQLSELSDIDEEERFLSEYIIDNLDDSGYLLVSLDEMADDLYFNQHREVREEDVEDVLINVVQTLEPAGIAARNLRECLMLQLQEKPGTPANRLAYAIVEKDYENFVNRRFDIIRLHFGVSKELIVDAFRALRHLNPKIGGWNTASQQTSRSNRGSAMQIRPEFIVQEEDGQLLVTVCDDQVPIVSIKPSAEEELDRLQQKAKPTKDEKLAIKMYREHMQSTRYYMEALKQRHETMLKIMTSIVTLQQNYFLTGEKEQLRPMTQKDVAEHCGMDISTISRACDGKAVQTDFGIKMCSELFSTSMQSADGEDVSNSAIKEALQEIIDAEDKSKPLSDDALVHELNKRNYPVARRTIAKYRTLLGIPVARMRKQV